MIEINGKNGTAVIYNDVVEEAAVSQVIRMMNHPMTNETIVRFMPDIHFGKGATVGTTIRLNDNRSMWKVCPNVVGVDIGCGMMSYRLNELPVTLEELDKIVREKVPSGFSMHSAHQKNTEVTRMLDSLTFDLTNKQRHKIMQSIGTLGGGNHFIEVGIDEEGHHWLTVHSGSRLLGKLTAEYHQHQANLNAGTEDDLAYLVGGPLRDYLTDIQYAQRYAKINRQTMLDNIVTAIGADVIDSFDSIHNYISVSEGIIRKGATSAREGERLIIPLNMRDGSLFCTGKGNEEWNYSAPHGAGRIMSRSKAKLELNFGEYIQTMGGIYSTSVRQGTIDESPMVYKDPETIIENIGDTVEINHHVRPIYNFKA